MYTSGTRREAEEGDGGWPEPEARSRPHEQTNKTNRNVLGVRCTVIQVQYKVGKASGNSRKHATREGSHQPGSEGTRARVSYRIKAAGSTHGGSSTCPIKASLTRRVSTPFTTPFRTPFTTRAPCREHFHTVEVSHATGRAHSGPTVGGSSHTLIDGTGVGVCVEQETMTAAGSGGGGDGRSVHERRRRRWRWVLGATAAVAVMRRPEPAAAYEAVSVCT